MVILFTVLFSSIAGFAFGYFTAHTIRELKKTKAENRQLLGKVEYLLALVGAEDESTEEKKEEPEKYFTPFDVVDAIMKGEMNIHEKQKSISK